MLTQLDSPKRESGVDVIEAGTRILPPGPDAGMGMGMDGDGMPMNSREKKSIETHKST